MSDQFFAVQFRSMTTAIHNIAVFSLETEAQRFFDAINAHAQIPEGYDLDDANFVGFQEIDFRRKPYEAFDMEILYMNEWACNGDQIPDVYNY